ncbi:MAG: 50S ribosomal protein L3 N(5)-glutamine methyltransferase [Coxiella sp. (in: Bacteria)]|nr:MAG: 50S ribosomal protein L3 N(5)-glutamine methyltransferase [Coxiella sp. (in: g-proteobacteria)]
MIIEQALNTVYQRLSASDLFYGHGIDNPWDEAVALVLHVLELPADSDDSALTEPVSDEQWKRILALVTQRIEARIPVAYLVNQAWFMGLPFYVDERVLVPRSPFAEWLRRRFEPFITASSVTRILEIGTGSGCIAIAASTVFPEAHIDATDISSDALAVAAQNVQDHSVTERVNLVTSDCFAAIEPAQQYDLIISNPPYVAQDEINELPEEYQHEPLKTALYADNEGMGIVDRILREAPQYMSEHAILIVEVGYSDEILMRHYPEAPFTWLECEFGGQGLFLLTREQLEKMNVGK